MGTFGGYTGSMSISDKKKKEFPALFLPFPSQLLSVPLSSLSFRYPHTLLSSRRWGCRYADREMVREFIGHCAELPYQKCLLIFRRLMDEETEYFPELTKRQVKEWIVRRVCVREDRTQISGYASLLGNRSPSHTCKPYQAASYRRN